MEQDPSQSPKNSNTIRPPAAAQANPGHLMYSHALHLTQELSAASYQYPADTSALTSTGVGPPPPFFLNAEIHTLSLNRDSVGFGHTNKKSTLCLHIQD